MSPVFCYRKFVDLVNWGVKRLFLSNPRYYYDNFNGTQANIVLILKNILGPKRMIKKIVYGQIIPLPGFMSKGEAFDRKQYPLSPAEAEALLKLRIDGFVFLPSSYNVFCDHILQKFSLDLNDNKPITNYNNYQLSHPDETMMEVFINEEVLKIFAHYYGKQPYLRSAVSVKDTYSNYDSLHSREKDKEAGKFQTNWHFDTANQLQFHLLLSDITENDSHMVLARAGHKVHRIALRKDDYFYSDEYIYENFDVVPLVGKKGTMYLFDSNTPHKAIIKKGTRRIMLQGLFTPGNDMLRYIYKDKLDLIINIHQSSYEALSVLQKNTLKYAVNIVPDSDVE